MSKILSVAFLTTAAAVAYIFWFVVAPGIVALLPQNEWYGVLKVLTYLIVAYFGGVGIPVVLFFLAISTFFFGDKKR